ncbi:hypothetical protein ACFQY7_04055 [Actinomadura luteofluorescens]|uniref:hypothetical protein n=1 Tax=Actinomadura luteofluorescens TaxID=46163 RepID=UPI0036332731
MKGRAAVLPPCQQQGDEPFHVRRVQTGGDEGDAFANRVAAGVAVTGLAQFGIAHQGQGLRESRGDGEIDPAVEEGTQHREPELRFGPAQHDAGRGFALIPRGIVQQFHKALMPVRGPGPVPIGGVARCGAAGVLGDGP